MDNKLGTGSVVELAEPALERGIDEAEARSRLQELSPSAISNGARSGPMLHLRSEELTVVIDVTPAKQ
jgi:hypothetical protein